ncbi:uncharacterized protein TNCV_4480551 [Trichonephila clavipes]|nr:uncharacterized protein TNCV_4480551 [Trichonephila clavipes]
MTPALVAMNRSILMDNLKWASCHQLKNRKPECIFCNRKFYEEQRRLTLNVLGQRKNIIIVIFVNKLKTGMTFRLNYQTDIQICNKCIWNNHESTLAVIGNCSLSHDSRRRSCVSRPPTVWLQAFPWPPSDQHTVITGTKAESACIRKHNKSSLCSPMSSGLIPLVS